MAKIKGLTVAIAARFRELSQVPTQRYFPDPNWKVLVAEEWEPLPAINTENGEWHWVSVTHDTETFRFQTHRNKVLDEDQSIKIQRLVCKETFTATNGKVVEEGTEKFVAMQG